MPATSRQQLLKANSPRSLIDWRIRKGELRPIFPGVYACDEEWTSLLAAHLLRGGPGSAVSHRSAARLRGLDGFKDCEDIDVTVPMESSYRFAPAIRSNSLGDEHIVTIGGLRVTSLVRTLIDLSRFATSDQLELAAESAFRGDDPKRPDRWKEDVLAELLAQLAECGGCRGIARMRDVLARRPPGARPTGSYVETIALQALRAVGLGSMLRQPTVKLADRVVRASGTWYPDLLDVTSGVAPEIDGDAGHAPLVGRRRDARRDNVLGNYLRVMRFPAADVLADPKAFALAVATAVHDRSDGSWARPDTTYEVAGNVMHIRRSRR